MRPAFALQTTESILSDRLPHPQKKYLWILLQLRSVISPGCCTTTRRAFAEILQRPGFVGGDKRDRTADLLNAIQALSQLSYTPVFVSLSVYLFDMNYYIS